MSGRRWDRSPRDSARSFTTSFRMKASTFPSFRKQRRIELLTELRTIHDWVVKPQLRSVPGVAEVNSWGGYEKQYQVRIDPDRLIKHELTFDEVIDAVEANNRNVGGGTITDRAQLLLDSWRRTHGQYRANREHRHQVTRRRADSRPRRGECRDWTRDSPRNGHGRWTRRSGARPGLHADGRKQPRSHLGAEE